MICLWRRHTADENRRVEGHQQSATKGNSWPNAVLWARALGICDSIEWAPNLPHLAIGMLWVAETCCSDTAVAVRSLQS